MRGTFTLSNKWDKRYIGLAKEIAKWSKDPSKQIGAVAIGDKGQVLAQGYNGFPRGIADTPERYNDRDTKYKFVVHAEMNVIYNASYNGVSLDGADLYIYGLPTCSECAKGIVQVGIKRVIMPNVRYPEFWMKNWEESKKIYDEAGVEYVFGNYKSSVEHTEDRDIA